jgi:hypothetical protein
MNAKFLRQIFGEEGFVADYMHFLQNFSDIIRDDNLKKVKYLTWMIDSEGWNDLKVRHIVMTET